MLGLKTFAKRFKLGRTFLDQKRGTATRLLNCQAIEHKTFKQEIGMVLKKKKKQDDHEVLSSEVKETSTQVPEDGPQSSDNTTDLDISVAAKAAAAPVLSSADLIKMMAEAETARVESFETDTESTTSEEVELPGGNLCDEEGVDAPEILESKAEQQDYNPPGFYGQPADLHFADRGTGEPLATENIDPFDVLMGASEPPPWPFDGGKIPEN
ncbi:hypothetical protein [Desulforhopalus sp. IMCC35007]|uniref:hypothetical protein n=1 Tax=Desulforhopalus sp. IMCC35007 TaxID=2569543 RepID=UPI0010AE04DA|nr:hypothetical protein [Desulforhopalus sp. IMCC35007]TKB05805.1 hypothetical protein FCL48_23380 [Desulforhopalus sp. IMCC35007]